MIFKNPFQAPCFFSGTNVRKIHYYSFNIPFFGLLNARSGRGHEFIFGYKYVCRIFFSKSPTPHKKSNGPLLGVYLQTGQSSKCLFQIKEKWITLYKGGISTRFPLFVPHNRMYSAMLKLNYSFNAQIK